MPKTLTKCLLGDKLMHPSEFVSAIEFRGKDVTLTIAAVEWEDLRLQGGAKERKPVLKFKETKKKLVCNKTNASSIAAIYGKQALEWIGKRITLYPTKVAVGGSMEDCIRIRDRVPGSNAPPPPAEVMADPEPRDEDDGFEAALNETTSEMSEQEKERIRLEEADGSSD